jgi:DNA polymerase
MIAATAEPPRNAIRSPDLPAPGPAGTLAGLASEIAACRRCPLYGAATQPVFGEGPADAPVVLVGEQPGDQEDLAGRVFVGPAGQLLDRALAEAGIDRARIYVTNAVKHFKYEVRGKRRIHQRPNSGEVEACRWWVERELGLLRPRLAVALGATAARALSGHAGSLSSLRGRPLRFRGGLPGLVTVHPSYLLRLPDPAAQEAEHRRFVAELGQAAALVPEIRRG